MATYTMQFSGVVEFDASADGDAQTQARDYSRKIKSVGRMRSFTDTTAVPARVQPEPEPDYKERFHARHDRPEFRP